MPHGSPSDSHRERVREFFARDEWKTIYAERGWFPFLVQQRLRYGLELLDQLGTAPGLALDVGCGSGVFTRQLLDAGHRVVACDLSAEMLAETLKRGDFSRRLHPVQADVECLPFDDRAFDLAFCIGVLGYLEAEAGALDELARVVVPGGHVIVGVRNHVTPGRLPRHSAGRFLRALGLRALRRTRPQTAARQPAHHRSFDPWKLDAALDRAGFVRVAALSHGFGPPLLVRRWPRAAERFSSGVERILHVLRFPMLSRAGEFYVVAARRRSPQERHLRA